MNQSESFIVVNRGADRDISRSSDCKEMHLPDQEVPLSDNPNRCIFHADGKASSRCNQIQKIAISWWLPVKWICVLLEVYGLNGYAMQLHMRFTWNGMQVIAIWEFLKKAVVIMNKTCSYPRENKNIGKNRSLLAYTVCFKPKGTYLVYEYLLEFKPKASNNFI